jgi:hypothetical protein
LSGDEISSTAPQHREPAERRPTARYARLVERYCAEFGRELGVLSPRDWVRIAEWESRGIPLQVIREAIEAVATGRSGRGTSGQGGPLLQRAQPLVEEGWRVMVEGRMRADAPPDPTLATPDPPGHWVQRLATTPAGEPLHALMLTLVSRWRAGESLAALDAALDAELAAVSPKVLIDEVDREVESALAPYSVRLDAEQLRRTRQAARIERLRRRLDLPRG